MINIYPIFYNKKQYLDLLLLADEQESMDQRKNLRDSYITHKF